jgi:hypothetical protein
MTDEQRPGAMTGSTERQAYRIRLPGFVRDEDIGLGDLVKRTTASFAIKPCRGCEHRAAMLNRWLTFTGRRSR